MENFQKLHRLTKLLHDHVVKYPENDEDRESYIKGIEEKLDERGEFLKNYKGPVDNLPKEQIDELLNWSEEINQHIALYRDKIKEDAVSLNNQKNMVKKYDAFPRPISFDGKFYDKRN